MPRGWFRFFLEETSVTGYLFAKMTYRVGPLFVWCFLGHIVFTSYWWTMSYIWLDYEEDTFKGYDVAYAFLTCLILLLVHLVLLKCWYRTSNAALK